MNIVQKVARNSGIILIGNILSKLVGLLVIFFLARYLGRVGFGEYSFALVFLYFFTIIENIWLKPILVREMAKDNTEAGILMGNIILIKVLFSFIFIALVLLAIQFIDCSIDVRKLIYLVLIILPLSSLNTSYEIIFRVHLAMKYFIVTLLSCDILFVILVLGIIYFNGPIPYFIIAMILTKLISLFSLIYFSKRFVKVKLRINFELWKRILIQSWPLALTAIFIAAYFKIDQIMLFKMKGSAAVGLYSPAVRIVEFFNLIPLALVGSTFPLMSRYFESSMKHFKQIYQLSFKYLTMLIIPIAAGITLFSKSIILLIFGREFIASSVPLIFLIWSEVFIFFGIVNRCILIASNKQRLDPVFSGVCALINVVLNLVLIPRYSFVGAAVATLISYAAIPIVGYLIQTSREYAQCMFQNMARPIFASGAMACIVYFFHLPFGLSLIISPTIYLVLMYIIKGIKQEDIQIVRSIISGRNKIKSVIMPEGLTL